MPGLLAVLVVLALAPSTFAQVQITLTPTPSPNEITTSHAAQTTDPSTAGGGILVQAAVLVNSPLTTTTLMIAYPATLSSGATICDTSSSSGANNPLSSSANLSGAGTSPSTFSTNGSFSTGCPPSANGGSAGVPAEDPIAIVGASGLFAPAGALNPNGVGVTGLRINTNLKRIEVDLPGFSTANPNAVPSGLFRITGVRLDMNGISAPVTATASLGGQVNGYSLSTTSITAVNGTGPGIASLAIGGVSGGNNFGTAAILTNKTVPKPTASLVLTSGFAGAWRTKTHLVNSASALGNTNANGNSTRIRLTWGSIPTGVTLTLSVTGSSSANGSFVGVGGTTSVTSSGSTADIEITSDKLTGTETLEVDVTAISLASTAAVSTPGSITVTASMAPFCTGATDASGLPTEANGFPCFTEAEVGPATVVNILPVSTTMLMPYALTLPPFDTGLAIANTTADPFGASGGGAIATAGTLVFNFFPTTSTGGAGTPFSLTTSSTVKPGVGLSSDGTLAAGATYAVLLSQLLTAAGVTGNFQGYIFITANFLDAHGTATISDFRTYSLTANVLVLPPPATFSRSTPGAIGSQSGAEFLHY